MSIISYDGTFFDDDPVTGPERAIEYLETARKINSSHHLTMALAGSKYHGLGLENEIDDTEIKEIAEKSILKFLNKAEKEVEPYLLKRAKEENRRYKIFTDSKMVEWEEKINSAQEEYEHLKKRRALVHESFFDLLELPVSIGINCDYWIGLRYPKDSNSVISVYLSTPDDRLSENLSVRLHFVFKGSDVEKKDKLDGIIKKYSAELESNNISISSAAKASSLIKNIPLPKNKKGASKTANEIFEAIQYYGDLLDKEPLFNEIKWGACGNSNF